MPKFMQEESWVIFRMAPVGGVPGPNAVCSQQEWEKMERDHPGARSLIRSGIANEGEAEQLARGTSGDRKPRAGSPGAVAS